VGRIAYTSDKDGRRGEERGRERFRIDVHADGSRTLSAHSEIDDAPAVMRDVVASVGPDFRPTDCFVRLSLADAFMGSAWFTFEDRVACCEAQTRIEGRLSQRLTLAEPVRAFGNHAIVNDGFLMNLYDLSQGPGVQHFPELPLSSPDHRGASGPMVFVVGLSIEYVGTEQIEVPAGSFEALHFRLVDVPGMPEEHPDYDLWCTADGDYLMLRAVVGGYMQTRYELAELSVAPAGQLV
jgi:hypothetical protein